MGESSGPTFPVCPLQHAHRQDSQTPLDVGTKHLFRSTLSVVHLRPRLLRVIYLSHMSLLSTPQHKTSWTTLHVPTYSGLTPWLSGSSIRPDHSILASTVRYIQVKVPSTDSTLRASLGTLLHYILKPLSASGRFHFLLSRGIPWKRTVLGPLS